MRSLIDILATVTDHGRALLDFLGVAGGILAAVKLGRRWIRETLGIADNERRSLENLMYNAGAPLAHRVQAAEAYIQSGHDNPIAKEYAEGLIKEQGGKADEKEV